MNACFATYKRACGGYHALLRLPRDGYLKPVLGKRGRPEVYPDALSAQETATRALEAYWNGNMRRDGETLSAARVAAEAVFMKRRAVA